MMYAFSLSGAQAPMTKRFAILPQTEVHKGQPLALKEGKAVAAQKGDALLGVAAEDHVAGDGLLAPRDGGKTIKVICDPTAVFALAAPKVSAASADGAELTVKEGELAALEADALAGAVLVLTGKEAEDASLLHVGDCLDVTASQGNTLTVDGTPAAAGSTYALLPPAGFSALPLSGLLSETGSDWLVIGGDSANGVVYVTPQRHVFGK